MSCGDYRYRSNATEVTGRTRYIFFNTRKHVMESLAARLELSLKMRIDLRV